MAPTSVYKYGRQIRKTGNQLIMYIAFLRPRFGPLLSKIDADMCEIKFSQYICLQPRKRIFRLSPLVSEISTCKHE